MKMIKNIFWHSVRKMRFYTLIWVRKTAYYDTVCVKEKKIYIYFIIHEMQ